MEATQIVAFDVDGTLITLKDDLPREEVIAILKGFSRLGGYQVIVWSGGGAEYAQRWVDRLGLNDYVDAVITKDRNLEVDIAFDDMPEFKLGKHQVIV